MSADRQIWVFVEMQRDGKLSRASQCVLETSMRKGAAADADTVAITCGEPSESAVAKVGACGVDRLYSLPELSRDAAIEEVTAHLACAASELGPAVFLFPDTPVTRDLAPRLAARLGVGLISHCLDVELDHRLRLRAYKAFGNGICETVSVCEDSFVQMATIVPPRDRPERPAVQRQVHVRTLRCAPGGAAAGRKRVTALPRQPFGPEDLLDAELIVGVGCGIGSPRFLPAIEALARQLAAPIGCTRKLAEQGWLPRAHQIGTSGKTVSPRLYLAIGLSGAVQHMMGVRQAETIVAINTDAHAPIFRIAHLGIVGDALEVVPALTRALENRSHVRSCSPAETLRGVL